VWLTAALPNRLETILKISLASSLILRPRYDPVTLNTFTTDALALIVRSGEGLLRRTRNLCLSSLIEAVRDQTRIVDLKQVNRVLIQPHWRKDCDQPIP
jgi:hypothetical protein